MVDGVSFTLAAGEALAVVGESGCGKTQLARAILGLPPEGGRVRGRVVYAGRDLLALSEPDWQQVRGRRIGLVFQEPAAAMDPLQTIGAQIAESIDPQRRLARGQVRDRARAALQEVGFPDADRGLDEYPHRLSGGLRQRALLAMTLAPGPAILLADEPTASLDSTVAAQVLDLLDRLRRERGLTILLITHDLGAVAQHCDRVLVLYGGRIVEEGAVSSLFRAPSHPYTQGLLRSVPRLEAGLRGPGQRYQVIPGTVADLSTRRAEGCAFAPRCPDRFDPCDLRRPPLYPAGAGRARCFLYEFSPAGRPA